MELDPESRSLSPLPPVLSQGLVAVATLAFLSFLASTTLFIYLSWRMITWRLKEGFKQPMNQFLILIYNLLLADIQQSIAFLLNLDSLKHNAVRVGTTTCWAQGWFISTGDLASSLMITAIGIHTLLGVVKGYRPSTVVFWSCLLALWGFVYLLGALGPLLYGSDFYVRAGAWCWTNHKYPAARLWLHYFWMFVSIFTCILTYAFIIIFLRTARFRTASAEPVNPRIVEGATPIMFIYPFIYTVCTTPLAAGRIYALQGHHVGLAYFCVAGAMIASNGWLDVLLYATTRREIVFSEFPPGAETGLETFAFYGKSHSFGTTTTIQANKPNRHERKASTRERDSESVENLYSLGDIQIKGEVSVKVEEGRSDVVRRDRVMSSESIGGTSRDEPGWDSRSVKSGKSILMNRS